MGDRLNRVGQQLGNYRLISLLGAGGFAEVYLAEHIHLGTKAAVKVLHAQLTHEHVEAFRTEARTIAHLVHPHIVRVLDFGVEGATPFLVMDYAPHGTLRNLHPKGSSLAIATIITYIKQVADALQYAHDEKLIHCDIKPENMLVGRRNEVLLSDFGIALVAQSTHHQSTQQVMGTVTYMSPEHIQGRPHPASDQYSLGIVVYEWLCGNRPFHGSFTEVCTQQMFAPPPPLREKMPTISLDIEHVVMTALAKDPKQRFASIQAFAIAFERASQINQSIRVSTTQKAVMVPYIVAVVVTTLLGLRLGLGLRLSSVIALIASAVGTESGATLVAFLVSSAVERVLVLLRGEIIGSEIILGEISTKVSEIRQKVEIWSIGIIESVTGIIGLVGAGYTVIGITSMVSLIVGVLLAGISAIRLTIRIIGAIIGLIIGATIVGSIGSKVGIIIGSVIGLITGFLAIEMIGSLTGYIVSVVLGLMIGKSLSYTSRSLELPFTGSDISRAIVVGASIGAGLGALTGLLMGALTAGIVIGITVGILATIVVIVVILEVLEKLGLAVGVAGVVMCTLGAVEYSEGFGVLMIGAMAVVAIIGTMIGAIVSISAKGSLIGLTGTVLGLILQVIAVYWASRKSNNS